MDEKNLLLNINFVEMRRWLETHQDIKLRKKIQEESILSPIQSGNYEFKNNTLNEYRKIFEKDYFMKRKF